MLLRSVSDRVVEAFAPQRTLALLLTLLGALTLALAVTGIYAVIAYSVGQRTREFGVRIALGARRAQVLRMVLRQAARPILIGIGAGLGVAWIASRAAKALLFGVAPGDPMTLAVVTTLLLLTGVAAAAVPAWRAGRTDPTVTLRD